MRPARHWWTVAVAMAVVACGEGGGDKSVVIASGADADAIFPLLWQSAQGRIYSELMFDRLAEMGQGQNSVGDAGYEPRLAKSWTWAKDSLSITFSLDPKARWHDSTAVTARDVQFSFQFFTDPKVAANGGRDLARLIDSISVRDSLTLTVWYKRKSLEQFHGLVYNLTPVPTHLVERIPRDSLQQSSFAMHPVGNGPFRFVAWEKGTRFEIAANHAYARGRPKLDRVVFINSGNAAAAARALFAGDADYMENLTADDVAEARKLADVRIIPIRGYDYNFLVFNQRTADGKGPNPIFSTVAMRRAITMAVDVPAMIKNVHDSIALRTYGPFARSQWPADTTIGALPHDVAAAERILDSLGWMKGKDGVRAKGGKPLAFTISVPTSSRPRVQYAELIQQALGAVGAKVAVDPIDFRAFQTRVADHKFDAALFSWRSTPSPSGTRQTWASTEYGPGRPTNPGGWSNATFDAQVDSGLNAASRESGRAHFRIAYKAAVDDAPAIWLYEPMIVAGANKRIVTGPMRSDAWWASIPSWDVTAPAQRAAAGAAAKKP